jgi:hypothetical protein
VLILRKIDLLINRE